jgi:uncharacterized membrane protein
MSNDPRIDPRLDSRSDATAEPQIKPRVASADAQINASLEFGELPRFESLLASLLHYGTLLASALIGLGLILQLLTAPSFGGHPAAPHLAARPWGLPVIQAGIALFILLPIVRVTVMLIVFVRQRDGRYIAITASVLLIILLGLALGLYLK